MRKIFLKTKQWNFENKTIKSIIKKKNHHPKCNWTKGIFLFRDTKNKNNNSTTDQQQCSLFSNKNHWFNVDYIFFFRNCTTQRIKAWLEVFVFFFLNRIKYLRSKNYWLRSANENIKKQSRKERERPKSSGWFVKFAKKREINNKKGFKINRKWISKREF